MSSFLAVTESEGEKKFELLISMVCIRLFELLSSGWDLIWDCEASSYGLSCCTKVSCPGLWCLTWTSSKPASSSNSESKLMTSGRLLLLLDNCWGWPLLFYPMLSSLMTAPLFKLGRSEAFLSYSSESSACLELASGSWETTGGAARPSKASLSFFIASCFLRLSRLSWTS